MRTITADAASSLGKFLARDFRSIFGPAGSALADQLGSLARMTIECIARSDALYHNYEHTWLVTMVGRDILHGLMMSRRIEPSDYMHLILACLFHDIGYVRGILSGDTVEEFVAHEDGRRIKLARGASDAALMACHVNRSKMFVRERLADTPEIDANRITEAIEFTRFPPSPADRCGTSDFVPRLVQAADFIGQLGDPMYPRKVNALFYEFEENGRNRQLGYSSPADLVDKYPEFFWNTVSMHIGDGMKYLNLTVSGRQWIANLHHHVLCAENALRMMGPQLGQSQAARHGAPTL
ncbi:HD domain-containing protein [Bradyrhizobium liaoningense]|uniref:HD domain-containing protein n=1 Tax=Bradyrhizobium liaoningense TaxID=43992 RepID=UPI001BA4A441|nr:HD domain-containing protein [Bradyrhizobium liaoningense]MBR0988390.1 HD domain-containing protein [Bradyrhizobium liaoningense]